MEKRGKKTNLAVKDELTPKMEMFCQLYASDREFFGNGTQSYIEAYGVDIYKKGAYEVARQEAYRLLTKPHILKRVDELMDHYINNTVVDKELAFVVKQKADLNAKVSAIREWNKIKKRTQGDGNTVIINFNEKQYNAIIGRAAKRLNNGGEARPA